MREMLKRLKTDAALFAAAFLASAIVLGANTSFAEILEIVLGTH